jgi:hypothetical protein
MDDIPEARDIISRIDILIEVACGMFIHFTDVVLNEFAGGEFIVAGNFGTEFDRGGQMQRRSTEDAAGGEFIVAGKFGTEFDWGRQMQTRRSVDDVPEAACLKLVIVTGLPMRDGSEGGRGITLGGRRITLGGRGITLGGSGITLG